MAEKTIRSHRARAKQAKYILKYDEYFSTVRVSVFDREAFVEFLLLEDVRNHLVNTHKYVKSQKKETREGVFYQKKQLETIHYLIYMLNKCIDIMHGKLSSGAYSDVWKAIHERQIMVAAGNIKYLDDLVALVETMLSDVDKDALEMAKRKRASEEFMDDLEAHDANVRAYFGLESETIADVVDPEEVASVMGSYDPKSKPNKN